MTQDNRNRNEQFPQKTKLQIEESSSARGLDAFDKSLLQMLQDDFPIVAQPWLEISRRLDVSESEVIFRLRRLMEIGAVLKVGPIFDASRIGFSVATLVAMRVPQDKVESVASVINQYSYVSHNYEREDEYNVWFTLTAAGDKELNQLLSEIKEKTGVNEHDVIDLPTIRRFKINVHFQVS